MLVSDDGFDYAIIVTNKFTKRTIYITSKSI